MEDKIINYISKTPENTNPAVLNTLLGDLNKQSDWNQNDKTQPDYVKNRPFYTGDPVETEIVPQTTVAFSEMAGKMGATLLENFDAVEGGVITQSHGTEQIMFAPVFYIMAFQFLEILEPLDWVMILANRSCLRLEKCGRYIQQRAQQNT